MSVSGQMSFPGRRGRALTDDQWADTLSLDVYFQQSKSTLEREYRGNGERMEEFRAALVSAVQEPGVLIRTIIVRAAASRPFPR